VLISDSPYFTQHSSLFLPTEKLKNPCFSYSRCIATPRLVKGGIRRKYFLKSVR